jgi:hypothetical protein
VLAGTDFFTVEVLTLRGLVTYYVLFFIHLESRKVEIAGITTHPTEQWMKQMARNVTMERCGALGDNRYLLHDRDTKYTASFLAIIESAHVTTLQLPTRCPNLNAYSERWVRSVREECLSKLILFGERSLRRAMREYVAHYHAERNHQGKSNVLLFPHVMELVVPVLWSVASGWAGSFVTTIETPRELATKSRSIAIRLWLGGPAEPNALLARAPAVGRFPKWRRAAGDSDGDQSSTVTVTKAPRDWPTSETKILTTREQRMRAVSRRLGRSKPKRRKNRFRESYPSRSNHPTIWALSRGRV